MARAKLHIICGNCGCNDMFEWKHVPETHLDTGELDECEDVYISCKNCSTLHCLSDNAKLTK